VRMKKHGRPRVVSLTSLIDIKTACAGPGHDSGCDWHKGLGREGAYCTGAGEQVRGRPRGRILAAVLPLAERSAMKRIARNTSHKYRGID